MAAPKGNKFAEGLVNSGRPPKFKDANELMKKCNEYFNKCDELNEKITITGLALFLGFESRQSLYDYAQKQEFTYIIKRAKLVVENSYENNGETIDIFALKNMGWTDKQDINVSGNIKSDNIHKVIFEDYSNSENE